MSKKVTEEERIVEFFNTADAAKVDTVFNIVKGIMKRRQSGTKAAVTKTRGKAAGTAKPSVAATTETVSAAA